MQVLHTTYAPKLPIPQDAWMIFQTEKLEVVRLNLKAGDAMEAHENPWDIVFHVIEGSGILSVENDSMELGAGDYIFVEAGKVRAWANPGSASLKLLVIKSKAEP